MPLATLPGPVKQFLRALQNGDYAALCKTLSADAIILDSGVSLRDESIRTWCEGCFSDGNFACHPIYALNVGLVTSLIVLRTESDQRGKWQALQQVWRFDVFGMQVAALTILPRPLPDLPLPIQKYINATNTSDLETLLSTFATDALVNDQLQDYTGAEAIAGWATLDIIGARLRMFVVDVVDRHGNIAVTAHVDGDFDGRGLPDPLVLKFHFCLHADRITQLIILRNYSGT